MTGETYEHESEDPIERAGELRQAVDANHALVDKRFGENLPYDRDRVTHEARFYLGTSAEAMLEAGKRLILLKEHESHGDFLDVVESLGLTPRTSQMMMNAAARFGGSNAKTFSHLNRSKLFLLAMEDQETVDELAEGGTVADLSLDDVDRMSVRELRAALRKTREDNKADAEARDQITEDKNAKLDELSLELQKTRGRSQPWPNRVLAIAAQITEQHGTAVQAICRLDELRDAILNEPFDDDVNEEAFAHLGRVYYDAVGQLAESVAPLIDACEAVFSGYYESRQPAAALFEQLRDDHPELFDDAQGAEG